jgi:ubiquinone/menaquinone biosynthesis C-methylase UbiE
MRNLVFDPEPYFALYSHFDEYNRRLAHAIRSLLNSPTRDILELGCGIGLSTTALLAAFPNVNITALDQSESMIAYASKKFSSPQIEFVVEDARTFLKQRAGQLFDLILIKSAYHLFEREAALSEFIEFLRPSAALVIVERTERSAKSYPLFEAASTYWSNYFSAVRQEQRLEAARSARLEVSVASYGAYVEVPLEPYIAAIRAGQLSFLEPFRRSLINSWCDSQELRKTAVALVFEEFWIYIYTINRTVQETSQQ